MNEWQHFTGEYKKEHYDVLLSDGTVVECCWPNSGRLVATDGSGREWSADDGVQFRLSAREPWDTSVDAAAARRVSTSRVAAMRTLSVAAAMSAGLPIQITNHRDPLWVPDLEPTRRYEPAQPGQRYRKRVPQTETDREALARAEAKRQRRANRNAKQSQAGKP